METQLGKLLVEAVEIFRRMHPFLGNPTESVLKVVKNTRFSSQLVSKNEATISKACFANYSLQPVPLESKVETKEDQSWGQQQSTAEKEEKTISGEGGAKLGLSKIWSLVIIDVNGKISCGKVDGTTMTSAEDYKSAMGTVNSHTCRVDVSSKCRGILLAKQIFNQYKSSAELVIKGNITFTNSMTLRKKYVSIGLIIETVLIKGQNVSERILNLKQHGRRQEFDFIIKEVESVYESKYVEFFYEEHPIDDVKDGLQTELQNSVAENSVLKERIKELESGASSSPNQTKVLSTAIA